ncbi:unnamed protein product [Rotaria socialis]|uniref:Fe2OG dioxygenase domain-containing protein n=1 Tax=Rotaria socialis TaxID=392032 RepID=A0A820UKM4_9BILA|nr:unnamed protein product [Rotaria socialis]CAF4830815.1 unnamed protein product [Rotaria socialis]
MLRSTAVLLPSSLSPSSTNNQQPLTTSDNVLQQIVSPNLILIIVSSDTIQSNSTSVTVFSISKSTEDETCDINIIEQPSSLTAKKQSGFRWIHVDSSGFMDSAVPPLICLENRSSRICMYTLYGWSTFIEQYYFYFSAWLRDEDSPVVARLSQLISALTNLTMETTEEFQIGNYGIGGYYSPHVDFYHKWEYPAYYHKVGNRIATWMTYMSDVEWGGATVFPLFGGYITPKKGSTLFWYNLHASGEVDYRTLHAACPVLIGNKWVANKWIHEYGQ